jgi:enoyl-CoA hydratase/carnithine racemase
VADNQCVTVTREGPVAILTMAFAPHNLLGLDLMAGMRRALLEAQNGGARAVLLKSGLFGRCRHLIVC